MKLREQKWLEGKLDGWVEQKLMTRGQVDAILGHERESQKARAINPALIAAAFGGLCVVMGIVLVVAHNWERIPAWWRQISFGLGLGATALAYARFNDKAWAREALAVLWLLLPLAGIGLWGQIYQLSGDPVRPLLVVWTLGLPLVFWGGSRAAAVGHGALLIWALFLALDQAQAPLGLEVRSLGLAWLRLFIHGIAWAAIFVLARRFMPSGMLVFVFWALLVYLAVLGESVRVFNIDDEPYLLWLSALVLLLIPAYRFLGLALASIEGRAAWFSAALIYAQTFKFGTYGGNFHAGLLLPLGAALLGLFGLSLAQPVELAHPRKSVHTLTLVLALPAICALLFFIDDSYDPIRRFVTNLVFVAMGAYWISNGIARGHTKAINRGVLFLALLAFTRFIDLFSSMLDSGLAFIVCGVGFVALAWAMDRGRRKLLAMAHSEAKP